MGKSIKIKKGLNINLVGEADKVLSNHVSDTYSIKPPNFHGAIPKLLVKEGAEVLAGTPLFFDKNHEQVKVCSPVSGEVASIVRGEKRKILEIRILADKEIKYEDFGASNPNDLSGDEVKKKMLQAGAWPFIRQRPYDVIANPNQKPKAIFISGFDSNPLAADFDFVLHDKAEEFQIGLDAIKKLTDGKVHLGLRGDHNPTDVLKNAKGVEINYFPGPHPAGNVGVQIHHIDPINKGEVVWYVSPQDVLLIGKLFLTGKYDATRIIALAGSEVLKPRYYKTLIGANIKSLVEGNVKEGLLRYISGNPLTGERISQDDSLGAYHSSITVIPETTESRFFGWITPNFDKLSASRTMFSWLMPNKKYSLDTSLNGEDRAFVMTGQYEKVFPFDIYPVYLLKAILTEDIEKMENLGIFEVAPEDFALCEFVCTSKMQLQKMVREGLDLVHKEVG